MSLQELLTQLKIYCTLACLITWQETRGGPVLLNGDPRPSVKELVKNQVRYYDLINVEVPEIVKYG